MKSKALSLENFEINKLSKSQFKNVFGGSGGVGGTDKPGLSTSSSSGAGATKIIQSHRLVLNCNC